MFRQMASKSGKYPKLEKELAVVEASIGHVLVAVVQGKDPDMPPHHLSSLGAKKDRLETELKDPCEEKIP